MTIETLLTDLTQAVNELAAAVRDQTAADKARVQELVSATRSSQEQAAKRQASDEALLKELSAALFASVGQSLPSGASSPAEAVPSQGIPEPQPIAPEDFPDAGAPAELEKSLPPMSTSAPQAAPAPQEPDTAPASEPPTKDAVRDACLRAAGEYGRDFVISVFKSFYASGLKDLDVRYYADVIDAFEAGPRRTE